MINNFIESLGENTYGPKGAKGERGPPGDNGKSGNSHAVGNKFAKIMVIWLKFDCLVSFYKSQTRRCDISPRSTWSRWRKSISNFFLILELSAIFKLKGEKGSKGRIGLEGIKGLDVSNISKIYIFLNYIFLKWRVFGEFPVHQGKRETSEKMDLE